MEKNIIQFEDIPNRFKQLNINYSIDCWLRDINNVFDRYILQHNLEINPDFQRGHVWKENQQIAFIEYMLRGGKVGEIYLNHNQWMKFDKIKNEKMVLVDGLQRYTAMKKFVDNKLVVFKKYKYENFDRWAGDITFKIFINDIEEYKDVIQWYIDLNEGGTPHTKEELDRVKQLLLNKY